MPQQRQPPYGPPPQNPHYGQPYPPQAPHSGGAPYPPQQPYGQQPAQSPYGAPYPHPHPAAWAAPPRKTGGVGLALGIVGGVVGLVVIGGLGIGLSGLRGSVRAFPAAEYELTLPKTLLDGEYELTQDLTESGGDEAAEKLNDASYARDAEGVAGTYGAGGDETVGQLSNPGEDPVHLCTGSTHLTYPIGR